MATKQITTWDEFKTALTEVITEDTTYELQNDIDLGENNYISEKISIKITSGYTKTINGNDHSIKRMSTLFNDALFYYYNQPNYTLTINNIKFENFNVTGPLFYLNVNYGNNIININNCYFNGICSTFNSGDKPSASSIVTPKFNKCSFNIAYKNYFSLSGVFTNCYIIANSIITPTTVNTNYIISANTRFINCYIGGNIKRYNPTYLLSANSSDSYQQITNCVFNVDIEVINNAAETLYYIYKSSMNAICLYNSDKITGLTTGTITARTNLTGLTDEQLKSKTYIQENTNFPLYG